MIFTLVLHLSEEHDTGLHKLTTWLESITLHFTDWISHRACEEFGTVVFLLAKKQSDQTFIHIYFTKLTAVLRIHPVKTAAHDSDAPPSGHIKLPQTPRRQRI